MYQEQSAAIVDLYLAKKAGLEKEAADAIADVNRELEDFIDLKRIEREALDHEREVLSEMIQIKREDLRIQQELRSAYEAQIMQSVI